MRRAALLTLATLAVAVQLAAQTWVKPAPTPNTDVKCTTCPGTALNKLTPGYPPTLTTYLGRFLDSSNVNDFQQHFRTARARNVIVAPAMNRLYFIIGSAVFAYDIDRFLQRLGAKEALTDIAAIPVSWSWSTGDRLGLHDQFLTYDKWFYAENTPSGWITPQTDGQDRLYYIDIDDQGNVYLAYTLYGWGIVHDDRKNDLELMTTVFQDTTSGTHPDDVQPNAVAVVKNAFGSYYAIISDAASSTLNVWNVTNREAPTRLSSVHKSMVRFVKTTDMTRIGLVTADGKFEVYNTDDLVSGGAPLVSTRGPNNSSVGGVATDGTNFFIASDNNAGLTISVYQAAGNTYRKLSDYATTRPTLSTLKLQYTDGYLVQSGITDGAFELRLFKVSNFQVSEIQLDRYFQRYYVANGTSGYVAAGHGQFNDSAVVKRATKSYLIATAFGLGDVYEIPGADSLGLTNQGSVGHANPNRPTGGAAGPFYGDPIGFSAALSGTSTSPTSIQWDFGNPEADGVAADPNSVSGVTGTPTTHRYSGLTSASQLPTTRTVKATSIADANVGGATSATLALPSVAVGLAGRTGSVTTAAQLAALPIVAGDKFVDASDGSIESHYDTWTLAGTPTKALPSESVSVGACGTSKTFGFVAHYGPYSGTSPNLNSLSDLPIGIANATYSVRPFAPTITATPGTDSVTFTGTLRATSDTSILTAAQIAGLSYKWELLDASSQVLLAGPAGNGNIPAFTVQKTSFTSRGIRAHLVITSATPVAGACAGLNMETADAFTTPINGPDPVINGGCASDGGPPCSFNVTSQSGVDPVADGWTYSWSVSPANITATSSNANTFTPTFTLVGGYTVSVTVLNPIGSKTVQKNVQVTKVGPVCEPPMTAEVNVFVSYQGAAGECSHVQSTPCNQNELIYFNAGSFGYDFACATHTFKWDFGDGHTSTGQNVTHPYNVAGSYNVSLTISNTAQTVVVKSTVTVGSKPIGCATMVANSNVFPAYGGPSGCNSSANTSCLQGEALTLAAGSQGYDFGCATHTFSWNFGDGKTATVNTQTVQHVYDNSGIYTVSLSVSNGTQTISMTMPVKIVKSKGQCPPIQPNVSVFIAYGGPKSLCTQVSGTDCVDTEDILFNAASFQYDFTCGNHTFKWDFGDSTATVTGQTPTHKFAAGQYTVKLAVTVDDGVTAPTTYNMSQPVKVHEDVPIQTTCLFDFKIEPRVVNGVALPNEYLFTVLPQNGATAASFEWDFGDGAKITSNALTQTHPYADGLPHTVTLKVPGTPCLLTHVAVTTRHRAVGR